MNRYVGRVAVAALVWVIVVEPGYTADDQIAENATPRAGQQTQDSPPATVPSPSATVQAGLVHCCSVTGFVVGGGVMGFPFGNANAAVIGDGQFLRIAGASGFYGSGNVAYTFRLPEREFAPLAGAGLGVFSGGGETDIGFQLLFGLEAPAGARSKFIGQVRFGFIEQQTVTLVLGGLAF